MRLGPVLHGFLFVVAGLAAGCVDAGEPVPAPEAWSPSEGTNLHEGPRIPLVTDVRGDAREYTRTYVERTTQRCGHVGGTVDEVCRTYGWPTVGAAADALVPDDFGAPAAGAMDIVGGFLQERPESLTIGIELDALEADYTNVEHTGGPEEGVGYWWGVGWNTTSGTESGVAGAYFWVQNENGKIRAVGAFEDYSVDRCNDWRWCAWEIPSDVEYGTPGRILLHIPWDLLESSNLETSIYDVYFEAGRWEYRQNGASQVRASVAGIGPSFDSRGYRFMYITDSTDTHEEVPLVLEARTRPVREQLVLADLRGDYKVPYLDILGVSFIESSDTITFALELAQMDAVPAESEDHYVFAWPGLASGRVPNIGYFVRDGEVVPFGGMCSDDDCSAYKSFPVTVVREPGEPGWANLTVSRSDIGSPQAGDRMNLLFVLAGHRVWEERDIGPGSVSVVLPERADIAGPADPYWFRHNTSAPEETETVMLSDSRGDVRLPASVDAGQEGRYDILFLQVEGMAADRTRVSIGIQDLSQVKPPAVIPGHYEYDALLYGASVQTETGPVMMGYYRPQDGVGEFFCAPDTVLFAAEDQRRDPRDSVWQAIEGTFAFAQRAPGPGGGAGGADPVGSISLFVPHACFDRDPGVFQADGIRAGTYLVQSTRPEAIEGPVWETDALSSLEGLSMGTVVAPAPGEAASPWFTAPFGIENFWDIMGMLLAILIVAATTFMVVRRRRSLSRYLSEIERAQAMEDSLALKAVLLDIHHRATADLKRGRLSEGHYVIVERRLEPLLARVRTKSVLHALQDFPYRVVLSVQEALSDNEISPAEFSDIERIIHGAPVSKRIRSRALEQIRAMVTATIEA